MALTTSCCFNISPPTPAAASNSSLSPKTPQVITSNSKNEGSWRNRCVLGMACMIIGFETSNLVIGGESRAIAEDMSMSMVLKSSSEKVARWSEKRTCPAWRLNSLETIVPENLPRPSAHRRWETVGYSKKAREVFKLVVKTSGNSCFSM
ncbi:protein CHLOROPLAST VESICULATION [Quercus robur]|uniref:protein CHLOROPLAST VESICULATION n=1 Tax=Quercus robur TaxID=38942 RepID=UPI00216352FA|nr:protein CHLOROPLAST VESICULATION [Quercus robur]